jgi:enoyl-[acyl-carrier protein] reductase II
MIRTEICKLFGIRYPIIQGGMVWVSYHELCAAVSEAGGLGMLAGGSMMPDQLRDEIRLVRQRTEKPFGINVPIVYPHSEDLVRIATPRLHEAGIKVMHVSPSVALAVKAAQAGVDAIVAEGIEAGGHDGYEEITTMALVPQVVDQVEVPVVAAGGIADSRGFVAALALGAKGVQIGTRFAATHEAKGHPRFKESILKADDTGTVITGRRLGPTRCVKNKLTEQIIEMERQGATPEALLKFIGFGRSQRASELGEVEDGTIYCGQIAGLCKSLKSAGEVVSEIIEGAQIVMKRLNGIHS